MGERIVQLTEGGGGSRNAAYKYLRLKDLMKRELDKLLVTRCPLEMQI